ncbi:hypothetical protein GCM10027605_61800 [Micromonospora zhanjiangensis]
MAQQPIFEAVQVRVTEVVVAVAARSVGGLGGNGEMFGMLSVGVGVGVGDGGGGTGSVVAAGPAITGTGASPSGAAGVVPATASGVVPRPTARAAVTRRAAASRPGQPRRNNEVRYTPDIFRRCAYLSTSVKVRSLRGTRPWGTETPSINQENPIFCLCDRTMDMRMEVASDNS